MYLDNDLFESVDSYESEVCGGVGVFDVGTWFGGPVGAGDLPFYYDPAFYTSPSYSDFNLGYLPIGAFGSNFSGFNQATGLISGILNSGGGSGLGALGAAGATFAGGARTVPVSLFW